METKQVTLIRVFSLELNDMRDNSEYRCTAAMSTSFEKLIEHYKQHRLAEGVHDGKWFRSFKEGPLHWKNPIPDDDKAIVLNVGNAYGHGVFEHWVTVEQFEQIKSRENLIYSE